MEHYKPLLKEWKADIINYAATIHQQMRDYATSKIESNPEITYQGAVNMFFCLKEAERRKSEFNAQEADDLIEWMKNQ